MPQQILKQKILYDFFEISKLLLLLDYETDALPTALTRLTSIRKQSKCDCQHLVGYDLLMSRVDTSIKFGPWWL